MRALTDVWNRSTMDQVVDGIILMSSAAYEPEADAATRSWMSETGRPVFSAGPLLPSNSSRSKALEKEKALSPQANEIQTFLDTTLKNSGEKSLLYVRCVPDN